METAILQIGTGFCKRKFEIVHNLGQFGFDIKAAFNWWKVNRVKLTPEMFCQYIRQKNKSFICMTADEFKKVTT